MQTFNPGEEALEDVLTEIMLNEDEVERHDSQELEMSEQHEGESLFVKVKMLHSLRQRFDEESNMQLYTQRMRMKIHDKFHHYSVKSIPLSHLGDKTYVSIFFDNTNFVNDEKEIQSRKY